MGTTSGGVNLACGILPLRLVAPGMIAAAVAHRQFHLNILHCSNIGHAVYTAAGRHRWIDQGARRTAWPRVGFAVNAIRNGWVMTERQSVLG